MAGHTPGPWHTYEVTCGHLAVADGDGDGLAFVATHKGGFERCRANARLIAAAPDMLTLLKEVEAYGVPRFNARIHALVAKIEGAA